jgi:serine/threonine-protein kinase
LTEVLDSWTKELGNRYEIERLASGEPRLLGEGGMAIVYAAVDLKHDRQVAIKLLRPNIAAVLGPERFLQEIRVTARLQHPHILGLIDSGTVAVDLHPSPNRPTQLPAESGPPATPLLVTRAVLPYYVMPLVEGESLRERLNREIQLSVETALKVTKAVASALDYAHRHGVIHRDIKPENILLHDDQPLVADFGIALALSTVAASRLTESGLALGTPQYMSPEQLLAEREITAASDIYSLACVLYEMLTGEPPFTGPTVHAIITKRLKDPVPPLRALREAVPVAIERALGIALATVPADRFATAKQFAEALVATHVPPAPEASIAVLPFANMSPDREYDYFADGMTEEIINALTQIRELRVAARSSSFRFKGNPVSPSDVARLLQVETILEGSVRKLGNRLRITVQLVNAADGYQLWSEHYDRQMHDVFTIQEEIAQAIADRLRLTVRGGPGAVAVRAPTKDMEAYHLYLKGRYFWARRDGESLPKAIEYLGQALARDAGFAAASAGLADAYALLGLYGYRPARELQEKVRLAAEHAITKGDTLADAHFVRALYEFVFGWQLDVADQEFRRAVELAPSSARPLATFSFMLAAMGRKTEALAGARKAQQLEPLSPLTYAVAGQALLVAHELDEALEAQQSALELEPTSFTGLWGAGMAYAGLGDYDAAIGALEKAVTQSRHSSTIESFLGHTYARAGRFRDARKVATELERRNTGDLFPGLVYWGLREEHRAFELLARGFEQRVGLAWALGSYPDLVDLGHDPRWIALLESVGLTSIAAPLRAAVRPS